MRSKPDAKFIPKIILETDIDEQIMSMSFNKPEIIIGRDPTCDFVINDERVSLHHCKIIYQQNQWWVEDLASTNGTFLNESFVNTIIILINGDILKLGHIEIKIII
jgi:pSer/pThr/pTyr-binding forkhead associated (FHA) protein